MNGQFVGAHLPRAMMKGAQLYNANFLGAELYHAALYESDMRAADLSGANLTSADLSHSGLGGAKFCPSKNYAVPHLRGWDVVPTQLADAKFYSATALDSPVWFQGAFLGNTKFWDVKFPGARFEGATLPNAEFKSANLLNAKFDGVDAPKINFSNNGNGPTNLAGTTFNRAYLVGADFTGANLAGAQFDHAVLSGANFTKVEGFDKAALKSAYLCDTILPDGTKARSYNGCNLKEWVRPSNPPISCSLGGDAPPMRRPRYGS